MEKKNKIPQKKPKFDPRKTSARIEKLLSNLEMQADAVGERLNYIIKQHDQEKLNLDKEVRALCTLTKTFEKLLSLSTQLNQETMANAQLLSNNKRNRTTNAAKMRAEILSKLDNIASTQHT